MGVGPHLTVRIETRHDMASLALHGELDIATVPIVEDRLAHVEGVGVAVIMLDLRELTFIDSTGLHALLRARDRATSNGHRLVLVDASQSTRRLLELTRTEFLLDDAEAVSDLDGFTRAEPSGAGREVDPQAIVAM